MLVVINISTTRSGTYKKMVYVSKNKIKNVKDIVYIPCCMLRYHSELLNAEYLGLKYSQ